MLRYAVMFDNFGPYHMGRLASLRAHGEVVALEASPTRSEYAWVKPDLPEGVIYAPFRLEGAEAADPACIERELERHLGDAPPDAIALPGWSSLAALVATRWAVGRGIRVIAMSETNAYDEPRRAVVEALKRAVVAHYAGGLTGSRSQAVYLAELGAPREAIEAGATAPTPRAVVGSSTRRFTASAENGWRTRPGPIPCSRYSTGRSTGASPPPGRGCGAFTRSTTYPTKRGSTS